jgi:predicted RNase H-like HicB family nuclease
MKTTYDVNAIRTGKWWALEVPAVPRAMSQARRLDQADTMIREALAMVLDVPEDSFNLSIHPILDGPIATLVEEANAARTQAQDARKRATERLTAAVNEARRMGLPVRDVAELTGVSYQYAAKIDSTK